MITTPATDPTPDAIQQTNRWHLHRGTVQWFIVGPGPNAWLACSAPDYASRKPTIQPDESALARAAIALLESKHSQDTSAGVAEIKQALTDAAAGVKPAKPHPLATPFNPSKPLKPESVVIDHAEVRRIKQVVSEITGVSVAQIESVSTPIGQISTAKNLYYGAVHARWPKAEQRQLAAAVNRSASTFGSTVNRHHYNNESFTDYARKFRRVLEQIGLEATTH